MKQHVDMVHEVQNGIKNFLKKKKILIFDQNLHISWSSETIKYADFEAFACLNFVYRILKIFSYVCLYMHTLFIYMYVIMHVSKERLQEVRNTSANRSDKLCATPETFSPDYTTI